MCLNEANYTLAN